MVMAGGDQINFKSAQRLLECFGTVAHVGPLAAGHAMKALNNYVSAAGLLASMQALATAESYGIVPEIFTKVINGSTGRNNTTEVKLEPYIIPRLYNSGFFLSLMAKDVSIAAKLIQNAGFETPTSTALDDYLSEAVNTLDPNTDHTGLYELTVNHFAGRLPIACNAFVPKSTSSDFSARAFIFALNPAELSGKSGAMT